MNANKIIEILNLKPLPIEGGFFAESYRADEIVDRLPSRYRGERHVFCSAIYYLTTPDTFSALHRLKNDEIFHFYLGDRVEMLQLFADGTGKVITLGSDLENGARPQAVVPKNTWQGTRLVDGGQLALLGTTNVPGFEWSDFEAGARRELVALYPQYEDLIRQLTRE